MHENEGDGCSVLFIIGYLLKNKLCLLNVEILHSIQRTRMQL